MDIPTSAAGPASFSCEADVKRLKIVDFVTCTMKLSKNSEVSSLFPEAAKHPVEKAFFVVGQGPFQDLMPIAKFL